MRKFFFLVPVACIGVAVAAQAETMKPGLWEITSQMSGGNMPKMPAVSAAQRKQMEAMGIKLPGAAGGPMTVTAKHCVTKQEAEKRLPPQGEDPNTHCAQKDIKTSGNTTTWKIECTGKRKMSGVGSMTWQGPERYTGESTFSTSDPQRGPSIMKQVYSGKWLAANCK